ncbi:MAG TPA: CDP-alcohol phosphatidyltransferase family protein [Pilimelia sp.]|nr:CDP-alcohol phosphatidyltransferase family protein [Pilimelia sp.]
MAKIFSVSARVVVSRVIDPVARTLLRLGVSPNAVTLAGTAGAVTSTMFFGVRGQFVIGGFVVTAFALADLVDGAMARALRARGEPPNRFGAVLDSTTDRIVDAAIFGSVLIYMVRSGDLVSVVAALLALVGALLVSYVKARAEGMGMTCDVGLVERPERLILIGIGGLLTGLGLDWGLPAALWLLAALSAVTVVQRLVHVNREAAALAAAAAGPDAASPAKQDNQ